MISLLKFRPTNVDLDGFLRLVLWEEEYVELGLIPDTVLLTKSSSQKATFGKLL